MSDFVNLIENFNKKFDVILERLLIKANDSKSSENKIRNNDNSILLVFNTQFDYEIQIYIIFIILWKLTNLDLVKIRNYMSSNLYFIKDVKTYLLNHFSKIESFLEKNFNYLRKENHNEDLIEKKDSINDLVMIKDKVYIRILFLV